MENYYNIKTAGIVLLNNYVPILFDRLGLVSAKQFKSNEDREKAALYLQYLATGNETNEEKLPVLNLVLCGLKPEETITQTITVTDSEKELMEGLLKAVINYWPSIGQSSVAGLRGNWLIRDGMLNEEQDRWQLTVEKRAYDVLISRSPFSFSIIRYPWMDKAMHVVWNY